MLYDMDRKNLTANLVLQVRNLNHSPRGKNGILVIRNLHHSTISQLNWTESCRRGLTWSWPVLVNSGQAWMTRRKEHDAQPIAYRTVICLIGWSSGNTAQCAYIGCSLEPNWIFHGLCAVSATQAIGIQLVVSSCHGTIRIIPNH